MAAYAATISLKNTIDHLLQSSRIYLLPPSPQILQLAINELETFQEILERLDQVHVSKSRKKVNALEGRIKEAMWKFEDLLESHLSHCILSSQFSIDLQNLQHELDFFINKLKDMKEEYIHELENMPAMESHELVSSEFYSDGEMVGLSDKYEVVRRKILEGRAHSIAIVGMPGIGKTRIAKKIYEDPEVSGSFDLRVWVTLGRNHKASEIARSILDLDPNFQESLKVKSCLIVLDDVWDFEVLEYLKKIFPYEDEGGLILVTSRLSAEIHYRMRVKYSCKHVTMRLLNMEESKELLGRRVFGERGFPSDIREVAEKIAKNCEGLPLMIMRVAHQLSEAQNLDPEYWNEVAKRRSLVFMDAYDEISKVLFPTFDCLLPQQAKILLINVVAFPHEYKIGLSNLVNLLNAERLPQMRNSILKP